jgi:hypothetical protein
VRQQFSVGFVNTVDRPGLIATASERCCRWETAAGWIDLVYACALSALPGPVLNLDFLIDYVMTEVRPLRWQAVIESPIPLKVSPHDKPLSLSDQPHQTCLPLFCKWCRTAPFLGRPEFMLVDGWRVCLSSVHKGRLPNCLPCQPQDKHPTLQRIQGLASGSRCVVGGADCKHLNPEICSSPPFFYREK